MSGSIWALIRSRFARLQLKPNSEHRDQLSEARSTLIEEARKLESDVQSVGQRVDPIATIIRNIRRVSGR